MSVFTVAGIIKSVNIVKAGERYLSSNAPVLLPKISDSCPIFSHTGIVMALHGRTVGGGYISR